MPTGDLTPFGAVNEPGSSQSSYGKRNHRLVDSLPGPNCQPLSPSAEHAPLHRSARRGDSPPPPPVPLTVTSQHVPLPLMHVEQPHLCRLTDRYE